MFTGESPWKRGENTTEMMVFDRISRRKIEFPKNMPLEAVDLIDKLLQLNPTERLGAGEKGTSNDYE